MVISSIMCSYNKEDWTVLAKMAEVRKTCSGIVDFALKNNISIFSYEMLYFP